MPVTFQGGNTRMNFDTGLLRGGQQVPFQRTVEPQTLGLFINIEQRDMQRLRRYEEHWRFYLGEHWTFRREDGEPLVTVNLIRTMIDKGVSWLVGNGMRHEIPEKLVDIMLPTLDEVWKANNEEELLYEVAQMGGVTGDAWLMVAPEDLTLEGYRSSAVMGGRQQMIRIQLLGSESVFPVWDPLNVRKLIGLKIINLYVDETGYGAEPPRQSGQPNIRRFTQILLPDKIIEQREGEDPVERPNPLGEIPVVHIRNLPVAREFWGMSDMDGGLLDLQRELNEKATDVSDIINYHAHPVTVIVGARVRNLEKGAKRVWSGFPAGTNVFNLQMESNLPASQDYLKQIQSWMLETGELPEGNLGQAQPISNTSGVALQTQYQSIIERVKRKRPHYERGLAEVNYLIIRWKEVMEGFQVPQGFCKNCGGKTLEVALKDKDGNVRTDANGRTITKLRCFHADPFTNDFTYPEDLKIKFVRQFSYGQEIDEAPRWRVVAELLHQRGSFWDPLGSIKKGEKVRSAEEYANVRAGDEQRIRVEGQMPELPIPMPKPPPELGPPEPVEGEEGAPAPASPPLPKNKPDDKVKEEAVTDLLSMKLPEGSLQVPEEPEKVTIMVELFNQATGQVIERRVETKVLVPTRCERPRPFNAYNIPVKLNDALPRDEHLDAQLVAQLVQVGVWSRREGMRRMKVENPKRMLEEIESEGGLAGIFSQTGVRGDDIPATILQGGEEARQAARGGANNTAPFQQSKPSPGRPKKKEEK